MTEIERGLDEQTLWRTFRDQRERCAGCGVRIKWEEKDVRGRAGGWVLAHQQGSDEPSCICFRCLDHVGPKTRFYLKTAE